MNINEKLLDAQNWLELAIHDGELIRVYENWVECQNGIGNVPGVN